MVIRRYWLRFGLRSLILLVSLVAILSGVWSNSKARQQRLVVDSLARAGLRPIYDSDSTKDWEQYIKLGLLGGAALHRPDWVLSEKEVLRREKITRYLDRSYADTLIGIRSVGVRPSDAAQLTDGEWKRIQSLDSIRSVHLGKNTTQEFLNEVCQIPTVVELSVETLEQGTRIPDLSTLPVLRSLLVGGAKFNDLDAKNIAGAKRLQQVGDINFAEKMSVAYIGSTSPFEITDEGLKHLSTLKYLRELNLVRNEALTEPALLKFVPEMTGLESIGISGTSITCGGARHIIESMPDIKRIGIGMLTPKMALQMLEQRPDDEIAFELRDASETNIDPLWPMTTLAEWFTSLKDDSDSQ